MLNNPQVLFVPWLHFHQPPIWNNGQLHGNLEKMLGGESNSEEHWNAQWFAQAYKNPARYAKKLSEEGHQPRMMVDYSGVLLEEMAKLSTNGIFSNLYVDGEAVGDVISLWREVLTEYSDTIEFTGSAYSHCYFPATPERDHEAQIMEWRRVFADLFGEEALLRIRGFWPPEMGMTGDPAEALRFIRLLKKCGYEWIILPNAALEHPEGWSTPELENRVHWLVVESDGESECIICVVRDTDMGIRQQSGQNAEGCINDVRYRGGEVGMKPPALVVPTSDGENGNVMMFEYFKNSFAPLFRESDRWSDVGFMTVSQYIDTYLSEGPVTEVRLKSTGGSWIGGHQQWQEGDLRQQVLAAVEQLSQDYAKVVESGKGSAEKSRALLLCETSCFVYWGSDFWAQQAKLFIEWAREMLGS
ncbi:MAG: glycoside hydrolase [Okeania sp. SIO2F4]|uniref:glycoside hydrolase n=1 Tax=Okeania sp. SIO2F4 TaxID=2607790 RepID=UPI00142C7215|nr:glycoside hydrolase [Okeania sp. SIO2F4]NES01383.1 glycoside hydrolase [Okeania sp. SIO2F4]